MAFLSLEDLRKIGFKSLGRNVKISNKASIYDAERIDIGDHSRIDDFCVISGTVKIGRNVHIAVFCNIAGGSEGITLEDFAGVAYGCQIFSQSDDYRGSALTGPTVPPRFNLVAKKAIRLGRHCIIGASSVVLPGVTLAEGTSVGAMSLVTKSTQEWSVYFGIPAKRIADRSRALLEMEREYLSSEKLDISAAP